MAAAQKSLRTIFDEASELEAGEQRCTYLDEACRGDAALRANVEELLRAQETAGGFLADPKREATAANVPVAEREGDRLGRYKLLQKIGEGGCGVVYLAEQIEPVRRHVALKIIKLGMDTRSVIARFEAERQAMALMDHPGIAQILDAGATEAGRPFFVMELVRGIKITDFCDQNHLSTTNRLRLFIQVCQAVQHAHQKGIIHRDLKPSNILVTLHDSVPVPKVIDFGIAKATEAPLTDATVYTQLHQFIGTPAYMSPEQAERSGLDIDTRSDIYSLGVLLYELLTSKTPFEAKELLDPGLDAMRKTIREKEPVRPSKVVERFVGSERLAETSLNAQLKPLSTDLDWIVMKCLEKDRNRRYDSAYGLAADLQRHLDNEPVTARPPSSSYRFQKLVRRHKLAFGAAAAVAVALLLGLFASVWQLIRATRAEQEQSRLRALAEQAQAQAETNAERFKTAAIGSRRSQYAADMFAATAAIDAGSYGRARRFLREYFPREGLEELRGFEWRYGWQLSAGQQLKTFLLATQILDMAWSPDGRLIAAATGERRVKFLDPDTGQVMSVLTNQVDWGVSVSFSHDGHGLATAGTDDRVRFWDVRDGRLLFSLTYKLPRVACSRSGPVMAVGTGGDMWGQQGESVHLVDTQTGQELKVFPNSGDRGVFSSDGRRLASANWGLWHSGTQAVMLWDVESGEKLQILGNQRQVTSMAFSPDGGLLAIGTRLGEITLWNLNDFSHTILRQATKDPIWSLAFSPEGRWLAVAMLTQEVEIWDTQEGRQSQRLPGHTHQVRAVAFSPNGARLASCSLDHTIKLWNPHPPKIQKPMADANLGKVGSPTFSADSRWLAAATRRGNVHIVDLTSAVWEVRTKLPASAYPVAFSKDASTLLTFAQQPKTLQRWDVLSGELLSTTALNVMDGPWQISAASPDGSRLALTTGARLEVCETSTGRSLDRFSTSANIEQLGFSPDGQLLAIASGDLGFVRDLGAARAGHTLAGHQGRLETITFSPDQKWIATGSWDHTLRLWEVTSGRELAVLTGHKAPLKCCVFLPDGRTLVSGSNDHTIKFWNLATLREVGSIQLESPPTFLTCSPDGQILIAEMGDPENDLRCWRVPSLAEIDAAEAKEQAAIKRD